MTFVQFIYNFAITFIQVVAPLSFGVFLAVLFALKVWSRPRGEHRRSLVDVETRSIRARD